MVRIIKLFICAVFSSCVLAGCFDMKNTYVFTSPTDIKMTMRVAIESKAIEKYNEQNKTTGHPFCKSQALGGARISLTKEKGDEVCMMTSTITLDQAKQALHQEKMPNGHATTFENLGEGIYRFTLIFNLADLQKAKKQAGDNPQVKEVMTKMFKNRAITYVFTASKIISTTGVKSNGGKTATITVKLDKLMDYDKPQLSESITFKL